MAVCVFSASFSPQGTQIGHFSLNSSQNCRGTHTHTRTRAAIRRLRAPNRSPPPPSPPGAPAAPRARPRGHPRGRSAAPAYLERLQAVALRGGRVHDHRHGLHQLLAQAAHLLGGHGGGPAPPGTGGREEAALRGSGREKGRGGKGRGGQSAWRRREGTAAPRTRRGMSAHRPLLLNCSNQSARRASASSASIPSDRTGSRCRGVGSGWWPWWTWTASSCRWSSASTRGCAAGPAPWCSTTSGRAAGRCGDRSALLSPLLLSSPHAHGRGAF